ncbi:MAG: hypothetical protein ABRQ38_03050 [Candidatus Eremiobacterota bacterium]
MQTARQKAIYNVNKELLLLYWYIGNTIIKEQENKA